MSKRNTALALLLALAACSKGERAGAPGAPIRIDRADDPIPSQYLVVLQPGAGTSAEAAASLLAGTDATLLVTWDRALRGFAVRSSEATARALAADRRVAWVAQDGRVKAQALVVQTPAPAGLDRIDQRGGVDGSYAYHDAAGDRVHAYVLDTGILGSHVEFLGRPPEQVDFVKDGGTADCNGHGTHVAGIIGGATWGVAKRVSLHSLRVLGCDGAGSTSNLIAALDWLMVNAQTPAVANLSLSRGHDAALDAAVAAVVARGIPVVVSAGDQGRDACASSPARVPGALTVASVDAAGTAAAAFTNQGPCVDLFAPGIDVRSASIVKAPASLTYGDSVLLSGTSVSTPFVTGAVALYLGKYTGASPATVEKALFANSTRAPATIAHHTPDRFLYTPFVDDDNAADLAPPVVSLVSPAAGAVVSGAGVAVAVSASDDVGVTRVELFANGRFVASAAAAPYAFAWNTLREPNGEIALVARAYDRAGNAVDGAPVVVTVSNPGVAAFDVGLGVPRCGTVASSCDSKELLEGRGDLKPEPNAPNTLVGPCVGAPDPTATCACPDGPYGAWGIDESIEQIVIRTRSGGNLAAGANVDVEVRVFVGSVANDALDLYSSPRVDAPKWRYLGSISPSASGFQTLTGSFTLPEGGLQAVRAAFRYGGAAATCTEGGFDDRDDLAFAVAAGTPDTTPPTGVAILAPRAGDVLLGSVTVTATATDEHLVSRVEFAAGPFPIGTAYAAAGASTFSVRWRTWDLPNGSYALTATGYDGAGNATVSPPVRVDVRDLTPPVVSIAAPLNAANITVTPFVVKVAAQDLPEGVVRQVDLEVDGQHYASDTSAPFEFPWSPAQRQAPYVLVAKAKDAAGNVGTSAPVQVTVGDTSPPTCSIRWPSPVTTIVGAVQLDAEAVDDSGVASVEFKIVSPTTSAKTIQVARSAPFSVFWDSGPFANGPYTLQCIATDFSGNTTVVPKPLVLTVNDVTAPRVTITAPVETMDATVDPAVVVPTPVAGFVPIELNVQDDGRVKTVELFLQDLLATPDPVTGALPPPVPLATLVDPPWRFDWPSGLWANTTWAITAKATDYGANSTTTPDRQVQTNDTTPPTVEILYPAAGAIVSGNVRVQVRATEPGGSVASLELYDGALLVTTVDLAPPANASNSPVDLPIDWSTTGVLPGSHSLVVKAKDRSGNVGSAAVNVEVPVLSAAFAPALGAPACLAVGTYCQSSQLLDGRGPNLGPEPNQPNTRAGACADGTLGAYHKDESIDYIKVSSRSGKDLRGGELVDVEVRAWVFDKSLDRVDLFYAADANAPVWVKLPAVTLPGNQLQTLTASYTLPHGALQAFRASIRYGTADTGPCAPGDFNDHDDLYFAVAPGVDTTPPVVSITAPAAGAQVSGTVRVAAAATDAGGVSRVEFLVDGVLAFTDTLSPWEWDWSTASLPAGARTLSARAVDASGNVGTSAGVAVTVLDQIPPTSALTAPFDNETVQGVVTFAAEAADDVGVTRVDFLVDNAVVASAATRPYTATWNSAGKAEKAYTLVARAYDSRNSTDSVPRTLVVSNTGNAAFDRALKVPACTATGYKCYTAGLLDGRGPLGPEPNGPNTLLGTCADGAQGSYHVDESIDAITVRSVGTTLQARTMALVDVKVWATLVYYMDAVDLFYTPNADLPNPIWEYQTTLVPTKAGPQVLSGSVLLQAGSLQAVRAQIRYGGAPAPGAKPAVTCGPATFDDRDDVVFAVAR